MSQGEIKILRDLGTLFITDSLTVTSFVLLVICLYLSGIPSQKDKGTDRISKKKEAILKLWLTENREKPKSDTILISKLKYY